MDIYPYPISSGQKGYLMKQKYPKSRSHLRIYQHIQYYKWIYINIIYPTFGYISRITDMYPIHCWPTITSQVIYLQLRHRYMLWHFKSIYFSDQQFCTRSFKNEKTRSSGGGDKTVWQMLLKSNEATKCLHRSSSLDSQDGRRWWWWCCGEVVAQQQFSKNTKGDERWKIVSHQTLFCCFLFFFKIKVFQTAWCVKGSTLKGGGGWLESSLELFIFFISNIREKSIIFHVTK